MADRNSIDHLRKIVTDESRPAHERETAARRILTVANAGSHEGPSPTTMRSAAEERERLEREEYERRFAELKARFDAALQEQDRHRRAGQAAADR